MNKNYKKLIALILLIGFFAQPLKAAGWFDTVTSTVGSWYTRISQQLAGPIGVVRSASHAVVNGITNLGTYLYRRISSYDPEKTRLEEENKKFTIEKTRLEEEKKQLEDQLKKDQTRLEEKKTELKTQQTELTKQEKKLEKLKDETKQNNDLLAKQKTKLQSKLTEKIKNLKTLKQERKTIEAEIDKNSSATYKQSQDDLKKINQLQKERDQLQDNNDKLTIKQFVADKINKLRDTIGQEKRDAQKKEFQSSVDKSKKMIPNFDLFNKNQQLEKMLKQKIADQTSKNLKAYLNIENIDSEILEKETQTVENGQKLYHKLMKLSENLEITPQDYEIPTSDQNPQSISVKRGEKINPILKQLNINNRTQYQNALVSLVSYFIYLGSKERYDQTVPRMSMAFKIPDENGILRLFIAKYSDMINQKIGNINDNTPANNFFYRRNSSHVPFIDAFGIDIRNQDENNATFFGGAFRHLLVSFHLGLWIKPEAWGNNDQMNHMKDYFMHAGTKDPKITNREATPEVLWQKFIKLFPEYNKSDIWKKFNKQYGRDGSYNDKTINQRNQNLNSLLKQDESWYKAATQKLTSYYNTTKKYFDLNEYNLRPQITRLPIYVIAEYIEKYGSKIDQKALAEFKKLLNYYSHTSERWGDELYFDEFTLQLHSVQSTQNMPVSVENQEKFIKFCNAYLQFKNTVDLYRINNYKELFEYKNQPLIFSSYEKGLRTLDDIQKAKNKFVKTYQNLLNSSQDLLITDSLIKNHFEGVYITVQKNFNPVQNPTSNTKATQKPLSTRKINNQQAFSGVPAALISRNSQQKQSPQNLNLNNIFAK